MISQSHRLHLYFSAHPSDNTLTFQLFRQTPAALFGDGVHIVFALAALVFLPWRRVNSALCEGGATAGENLQRLRQKSAAADSRKATAVHPSLPHSPRVLSSALLASPTRCASRCCDTSRRGPVHCDVRSVDKAW